MKQGVYSKFPFDEFRYGQKHLIGVLNKIIKNDAADFSIIQAPTGFGKTAVAGTISAHHSPSYYLTEQKIHQDQMVEEFPRYTQLCKGQRNYCCAEERNDCPDKIPNNSIQCHRKPSTEHEGSFAGESARRGDMYWKEGLGEPCPYFWAKTNALESEIACLNYSYFFNETYYSGDFGKRKILVCDEAHNIERNMQSFLTFRVGDFIKEEVGLEIPDFGYNISDWEDWILGSLQTGVTARLNETREIILDKWEDNEDVGYELLDTQDKLDEILCNINRFGTEYDSQYFDDMDWAVEHTKGEDGELNGVKFTPVTVAPFANKFLFDYADHVILLSATILDPNILTRSLGLKRYQNRTYYTSMPSPFPEESRPIEYFNAPSINHNNWKEVFPKTVQLIDTICQKPEHLDQKGLIHSVSYNNEKAIRKHVSRPTQRRLMSHGEDEGEREDVLEEFKSTDEPKVLMSPAMYEGVDLKYDLSRFQIVPKIPYLSLGSSAVKKKKQRDPQWYDWRTVIRLLQSFGRSVRAKDDYAHTYILDGNFENFYNRNQNLFPEYITGETDSKSEVVFKGDVTKLIKESLVA